MAWSAGAEEVGSVKTAEMAGVLPGKTVTWDKQGATLGGNDADGECPGGGDEGGENVTGANALLTAAQKKEKKQQQQKDQNHKYPSQSDRTGQVGVGNCNCDRTTWHLRNLSKC